MNPDFRGFTKADILRGYRDARDYYDNDYNEYLSPDTKNYGDILDRAYDNLHLELGNTVLKGVPGDDASGSAYSDYIKNNYETYSNGDIKLGKNKKGVWSAVLKKKVGDYFDPSNPNYDDIETRVYENLDVDPKFTGDTYDENGDIIRDEKKYNEFIKHNFETYPNGKLKLAWNGYVWDDVPKNIADTRPIINH